MALPIMRAAPTPGSENIFGCDSTITIDLTIENTTSIDKPSTKLLIYPNPTLDTLNITIQEAYIGQTILLTDASGKRLWVLNQTKLYANRLLDAFLR